MRWWDGSLPHLFCRKLYPSSVFHVQLWSRYWLRRVLQSANFAKPLFKCAKRPGRCGGRLLHVDFAIGPRSRRLCATVVCELHVGGLARNNRAVTATICAEWLP